MTVALALTRYGLLTPVYHGPPRLVPARAFTEWSIDPYALAVLVLLGAGYALGVRRVRRAGSDWSAGRIVIFGFGLLLAFIATSSFLEVYGRELFYIRSFQTVLLLLGIPLFLMLGRPLSLIIGASPRRGQAIQAALTGRVAKLATFPLITSFWLVLTPFVVYFSPWYGAGFGNRGILELTYLALLLPGLVFFWTLLRVDPVPRQYPYIVALWVTAAEVVGDAALGLAVIADRSLIAGSYYHAVAWPWGPTLASDQVIGGGTLWVFGDVIGLPFLAAILIAMMREDESEQRTIDAELDAQEAADATTAAPAVAGAAVTAAQAAPATADAPARPKLWWENDPRFATRFAPVEPNLESNGQADS
jgi:cytochrome c oxidase assembly factor CtaG